MIAAPWLPVLRRAARSYVAGPELSDALRLAQKFAARGVPASTLCFWDAQDDAPEHVAAMYSATVRAIESARLDSYVSIKAPALDFDAALLAEIAQLARETKIPLHFDSLGPETVDRTFRLIEQLLPCGIAMGCTIPGRWRRSPQDAAWAAHMGLRVRVVKGQWEDPAAAAHPHSGFLEVIDALAGSAATVAVATHQPELAAAALGRLRASRTPCEMELLHGLPSRSVLKIARDLGVPVRYYLPYGHAWLPYALRQARRNPRILWWVLRDASRSSL